MTVMKDYIEIDGRRIGKDYPVYIIAEMSANHMQNLERAKEIIRLAKEAGADAVKLQSYKPDTITIDCHGDEFMTSKGSLWEGQTLFDLYKEAYMPWEWHEELFDYAKEVGITVFSSPFDPTAVELLKKLDAPAYKIASYELNDVGLIEDCAKTGKPVIMSTGIAYEEDVRLALKTCYDEGNEDVILLKCVSEYPSPYEDINLRTIPDMVKKYDCIVGLSDHTFGYAVDVAAVALGAKVIEKHMTIKRSDGGADSGFSMEYEEFKEMVESIRQVEKALGKVTYDLTPKQVEARKHSRSLYVVKDVKAGEEFTSENVRSIRPGLGLHTKYLKDVLGKKSNRDLLKGTAFSLDFIEK